MTLRRAGESRQDGVIGKIGIIHKLLFLALRFSGGYAWALVK